MNAESYRLTLYSLSSFLSSCMDWLRIWVHLHNKATRCNRILHWDSYVGHRESRFGLLSRRFSHVQPLLVSSYLHCPSVNKGASDSHLFPIYFPDPITMDLPAISPPFGSISAPDLWKSAPLVTDPA